VISLKSIQIDVGETVVLIVLNTIKLCECKDNLKIGFEQRKTLVIN